MHQGKDGFKYFDYHAQFRTLAMRKNAAVSIFISNASFVNMPDFARQPTISFADQASEIGKAIQAGASAVEISQKIETLINRIAKSEGFSAEVKWIELEDPDREFVATLRHESSTSDLAIRIKGCGVNTSEELALGGGGDPYQLSELVFDVVATVHPQLLEDAIKTLQHFVAVRKAMLLPQALGDLSVTEIEPQVSKNRLEYLISLQPPESNFLSIAQVLQVLNIIRDLKP